MLTRFAPSPTGYLHLGHAYAATQAFGAGPCLLRIEDIDLTRARPEFYNALYEDLRWLGFNWPEPVRIQSQHLTDYQAVIDSFESRGLLYKDYKTRSGQDNYELPPAIKLSTRAAIRELGTDRLSFQEGDRLIPIDLTKIEDETLVRRDIGTSYHVAVTHDDWVQGISDVVRGLDLFEKTAIHVLIQTLMGWPVPHYHHHALIMDRPDRKMSKRSGSQTIRSLRTSGVSVNDVLMMAKERVQRP